MQSHWTGVWIPCRPDEARGEQTPRLDQSPRLWSFLIIRTPPPTHKKESCSLPNPIWHEIFSSSAELWDLKCISAKETVGLMDATKITVGNIWKTSLWGWAFPPAKETLLGNYRHSCICCWVQPCTPFCRTLDGITDTEKISGCSSKISAGLPLTPTSVWISEGFPSATYVLPFCCESRASSRPLTFDCRQLYNLPLVATTLNIWNRLIHLLCHH